ncbi:MAG: FAD-dependent thymidylate synthase [Oscillospiraceae bacterium]|nr:FAD-dependent thymidylate synthase [Oscillospiraceae bacterium]
MKVIKAGYEIMTPIDRTAVLKSIETAARCCYKSEDKITDDSASGMVRMLVKHGHEAMIEHCGITVKFICDRGVSHEIVRHRIASYAQESTRYVNYSKGKFGSEITVIKPLFYQEGTDNYNLWYEAMLEAEKTYMALIENGSIAQEARAVLPSSLKTEIVVTMNMRAWRNFFRLRTANAAHPQIQEIAKPLLAELKETLPELFEDIEV